jgi:uncharacterized protein with gpF-like domain
MPEEIFKNLSFDAAIAYFRDKLNLPTETWTDIWQAMHTRAFVVAGVTRADMLMDFREAVDAAIADGTSLNEFRKGFDTIVERYGWQYTGGRNWRSRVIFETNVRTAYAAGRWHQMTDKESLSSRPYLEYHHGDSMDPRPQHLAWNGLVLPADDPWWKTHYPPNGWGCKCTVFALSERDMQRLGKSKPDTAPDDGTYTWENKRTGEVHTVPNGIDPGWAYNPGENATYAPDLSKYPKALADQIKEMEK